MGRKKTKLDVRVLPVDSINEPKMLVRDDMGTQEEMLDLGKSIKDFGQIEPIIVVENGERFDLVVGHRRLHASKLVGMITIEAKIITATLSEQALMRYKENNERLANSPYEEALFIREMLDNIKCSQVELSKMLGKSPAYVTQRLAILNGYKNVGEALRTRKINFVQARELLLMPDEDVANQYLEITIQGGANADLLRQWRRDVAVAYQKVEEEETTPEEKEAERQALRLLFRKCEICSTVTDPADLTYIKACRVCNNIVTTELNKFKKE